MKEYHEIDLNDEPCIFPVCGHFLTLSSMDGQVDMAACYELDGNGQFVGILRNGEPFSMGDSKVPACATCRGPLRNIARYGRIVRGAMLDETTKRFILWSNTQYGLLVEQFVAEQERLETTEISTASQPIASAGKTPVGLTSRRGGLECLMHLVGQKRYKSMMALRNGIRIFADRARREEQPIHRVADLVRHARRKKKLAHGFDYDDDIIQTKANLQARVLFIQCEIALFSDFVQRAVKNVVGDVAGMIDLSSLWTECETITKLAETKTYRREETQGHLFAAQLCGLCKCSDAFYISKVATKNDTSSDVYTEKLESAGLAQLDRARGITRGRDSIAALNAEIDAAEEVLMGATYRPVTAAELKAVYAAMSTEFRGTGHWYRCENGHPFTIGECGMAMEMARCPECDAPVGGSNHQTAEGVEHDRDMEQLGRHVDDMRL